MRTLITVLLLMASQHLLVAKPSGPPWFDTCQPMELDSLRYAFRTKDCRAEFEEMYPKSDATEVREWMIKNHLCLTEWAHFSWLGYTQKTMKMAEIAWKHQTYLVGLRLIDGEHRPTGPIKKYDIEPLLREGSQTEISKSSQKTTDAFLDEIEKSQSYKKFMDQAYDSVNPVCLYHMKFDCPKPMKQVLDWMYPRSYRPPVKPAEHATVSMVPFYRKNFTDTLTQKYASKLALYLYRFIETEEYENTPPVNLYDLGMKYFENDADRFWEFMAVYSTRGAAWATVYPIANDDTKPLFAAHMVISAAMGFLDTYYLNQKTAFSYSADAVSTCYQPKPYHFWMAASMAYLLKREGYGAEISAFVGRLMGALYEIGSTTMGRKPEAVFFVPTFDTIVNRTRRETTHHFLGAQFGAELSDTPLSFDETLLELMEASKPLPKMSAKDMKEKIKDPLTKWKYWTSLIGYYSLGERNPHPGESTITIPLRDSHLFRGDELQVSQPLAQ